MYWIAITGSWRHTNQRVEQDVRATVRKLITQGCGIITGGALGVDWLAVDEALKHNPLAEQVRVVIPASLARYLAHYFKRADEGVISHQQAQALSDQLTKLKTANPLALIELEDGRLVEQASYYDRNSQVVAMSDKLYAFQVNKSRGTQDTIDKARAKGIPVCLKRYEVSDSIVN
jgi:CRP-like cAMP-binding protein